MTGNQCQVSRTTISVSPPTLVRYFANTLWTYPNFELLASKDKILSSTNLAASPTDHKGFVVPSARSTEFSYIVNPRVGSQGANVQDER